ncbi:MAG TPA: hypothetical protein VMU47_00505 [Caldimonas sp.]|nr:hypothetical protein [Caldimonas sp.]
MNRKPLPSFDDADWASLLRTEQELSARIADAEAEARARVADARAAAARTRPDPAAAGVLAAAQEQADIARQRDELAGIAAQAEAIVRRCEGVPGTLIDALAQQALTALWAEQEPSGRR